LVKAIDFFDLRNSFAVLLHAARCMRSCLAAIGNVSNHVGGFPPPKRLENDPFATTFRDPGRSRPFQAYTVRRVSDRSEIAA
jgi:hypothetical protein